MTPQTHPIEKADLRFFARSRRIAGLAGLALALLTVLALFRSPATAVASALALLVAYGIWLFLSLVERREALRSEVEPESVAGCEIAAEGAELRTALVIGGSVLATSLLVVLLAFGSKWLGAVALLLFVYLMVIGGPYWLAQVLARGEDARRHPR